MAPETLSLEHIDRELAAATAQKDLLSQAGPSQEVSQQLHVVQRVHDKEQRQRDAISAEQEKQTRESMRQDELENYIQSMQLLAGELEDYIERRLGEMGVREKFGKFMSTLLREKKRNWKQKEIAKIVEEFWADREQALAMTYQNKDAELPKDETPESQARKVVASARGHIEQHYVGLEAELQRAKANVAMMGLDIDRMYDRLEMLNREAEDEEMQLTQVQSENQAEIEKHQQKLAELEEQIRQLTEQREQRLKQLGQELSKDITPQSPAETQENKPASSLRITRGQEVTVAAEVRFDEQGQERNPQDMVNRLIGEVRRAADEYALIYQVVQEDQNHYTTFMDKWSDAVEAQMGDVVAQQYDAFCEQFGVLTEEELQALLVSEQERMRKELGADKKYNPDDYADFSAKVNADEKSREKKVKAHLKKIVETQERRRAKVEQAMKDWMEAGYIDEIHGRMNEGAAKFHEEMEKVKNLPFLDRRMVATGEYVDELQSVIEAMDNLAKWKNFTENTDEIMDQIVAPEAEFIDREVAYNQFVELTQTEIDHIDARIGDLNDQIAEIQKNPKWKDSTKDRKSLPLKGQIVTLQERKKDLKKSIAKATKELEKAKAAKDAKVAQLKQELLPAELNGQEVFDEDDVTHIATLYKAAMNGVEGATISRKVGAEVKVLKIEKMSVPLDQLEQDAMGRVRAERQQTRADYDALVETGNALAELQELNRLTGERIDKIVMSMDDEVLQTISTEYAEGILEQGLPFMIAELAKAQKTLEQEDNPTNREAVKKRLAVLKTLGHLANSGVVKMYVDAVEAKLK